MITERPHCARLHNMNCLPSVEFKIAEAANDTLIGTAIYIVNDKNASEDVSKLAFLCIQQCTHGVLF